MSEQYYLKARSGGPSDLFVATTSGSSPKANYIGSLMATMAELGGLNVDWLLHQGDCHVDDRYTNSCSHSRSFSYIVCLCASDYWGIHKDWSVYMLEAESDCVSYGSPGK